MTRPGRHGALAAVWRAMLRSQRREQPLRLVVTVLAIALGVSLGTAVYLVDAAALNDFGQAAKRLVGEADVVIRGPREGFSEGLFPTLAGDPRVRLASPVLELKAALPGRHEPLEILGLDPFRAAAMQPALLADLQGHALQLFAPDAILLSAAAAADLGLVRGASLEVVVGNGPKILHVIGVLPKDAYGPALGIMDIASAQWAFERLGRLNRIDLRLRPGTSVDAFRDAWKERLPPGTLAIAPGIERNRAVTVTRAYRVNLNMLALVSLLTGSFLVFATQSLSVLRRRGSLGLLRALGATRRDVQTALIGEGAVLGLAGSMLGVLLGVVFAEVSLRLLDADLGNGQLRAEGAVLHASPSSLLAFVAIGTLVTGLGAWWPARAGARSAPAQALKGGDMRPRRGTAGRWVPGLALLLLGAAVRLPPIAGLPIAGYASIAALLFGAVLLVPALAARLLAVTPRLGRAVAGTALAQLRDNIGMSSLALSSIIVSFSLMVAMAIMVHSFRESFDHWLVKLLPAELQMREPQGNDTAYWPPDIQAAIEHADGVSRAEFRRTRPLLLDPARPPVTLIARGSTPAQTAAELPLLESLALPLPAHALEPAWVSEALEDLYGYKLGATIELPLNGMRHRYLVAGVWRDYARSFGAVVITRTDYIAATGDLDANEASVWLTAHAAPTKVIAAIRAALARVAGGAPSPEILTGTALRERSLNIFDRAFAITYALEAAAVVIGLMGVSFAAGSAALARRAEFGMLRHIGMQRRQVIGMLAAEGVLMSACGVAYGLLLGAVLSLVLVYVVNRQSFNWSIDLAIPVVRLVLLSLGLIAAAALTAVWSGRAATSKEALRAVREDW